MGFCTITPTSKPDEPWPLPPATTPHSVMERKRLLRQLSFKWEGGMWEYDPYHNSIITAEMAAQANPNGLHHLL